MKIIKKAVRLARRHWARFRFRLRICGFGKKVNKDALIVGVPDHSNIGDMAIALAEGRMLRDCGASFASLSTGECERYFEILKRALGPNTLICLHGGGNIGNVYGFEEEMRRRVLTEFKENPTLIFPQTIYFTPDCEGEKDMERAAEIYNAHKDLTLATRDESSYELAKKLFPSLKLIQSPDVVMQLDKRYFGVADGKRKGVLLCFRGDVERALSDKDREKLETFLTESGRAFAYTDTLASIDEIPPSLHEKYVSDKLRELSGASLVITDRLHGMVFSAIAETPCIAFGNYNHKVEQSYKMLEHLGYINFVKSADDAISLIDEACGREVSYDKSPILPKYGELKNYLLEHTGKQ